MQHKTEWFLIADATRARLAARVDGGLLKQIASFEHLASRRKTSELGDDKAGREMSGSGFGGSAFEPKTDAHRKEHLRFAHELAQYLEHEAVRGSFDALSIFAPNPFFGELKQELGKNTGHRLGASRPVDLIDVGAAELEERIQHAVAS
ncbi:MAG TPA: host attachment protein [Ramlibacter sp.]|uniref:host attachment protein n=1 Tax=Ramlibacter sp. TaxID=1917967 RepID=UPI002C6BA7A9|nr:host attachment protein [Ramlibacter sp.]HVZ42851.1 host attachment protein [Ramlibacter sp.]